MDLDYLGKLCPANYPKFKDLPEKFGKNC
jgi:hypothetical protein